MFQIPKYASFTHSSLSRLLPNMLKAIFLHSGPYFFDSSSIACSERSKNNSIICKKLLGYDISCEQGMKDAKNKNLFTTTCVDMITDAVMILEKLGY